MSWSIYLLCLILFPFASKELELYKEELVSKPALLVVNKMDLPDAEDKLAELKEQLQNPHGKVEFLEHFYWNFALLYFQHSFSFLFCPCRILWSFAWGFNTKELYNLQTCGSCLCLHWAWYWPFETLHQRITWWRCRNGKQSHSRRTTADTEEPLTAAFSQSADGWLTLPEKLKANCNGR